MPKKIVRMPDGYYVFRWEWGSYHSDGPHRSWFRAWLSWLFS